VPVLIRQAAEANLWSSRWSRTCSEDHKTLSKPPRIRRSWIASGYTKEQLAEEVEVARLQLCPRLTRLPASIRA